MSIGERFKQARKYLRLTQEELANELGISRSHVSNIESDREKPSLTLLKFMSYKYAVPEDWLLSGEDDKGLYGFENQEVRDFNIEKFQKMCIILEQAINAHDETNLIACVDAFAYLTSALTMPKNLSDDELEKYLQYVASVIDNFEKLLHQVARSTYKPIKGDAVHSLRFKKGCEDLVHSICESAKNTANIFLAKYFDEMKL
jgi:transcriptional regulator with XRE-family HTH domain